jgi:putative salt-induced outer membrane protein
VRIAGAMQLWLLAPAVWLIVAPAPARAADLPDALTTMIREAHPQERKVVTNIAKRLYPSSIKEIDLIVKQIEQEERTSIAGATLLEGWSGQATLGGFRTTGNTDEWGVSAALLARRRGPRWTHEFEVRVEVKEEDHARTEERGFGKYTLRRTFGASRWFAYGRLSFERDRFQGIESRFFESIGIGYRLAKGPSLEWDAMIGPGLRQTDYSQESAVNEPAVFLRTKLEWKISNTLRFTEEADSGLAKGNSTFTSTTALTSNLYGRLSGRLSFGVEMETDPPPGREKTDTYTRASLVYDF